VLAMENKQRQLACADLFNDQRVLVLGLGKTGLSCVCFLAERGIEFSVMDSRDTPPGADVMLKDFPSVNCVFGSFDIDAVNSHDVFLVSPGISLKQPLLKRAAEEKKQILGDIDVFAQCSTKPLIAITGSNGKSTVTALLGEMAQHAKFNVAVGGNIGIPVLDLLVDDEQTDLYVLELSSFQLETTQNLNAVVSTILNVSEDHMDRYDSMHDYAQAKQRIYFGDGAIVVNKDEDNEAVSDTCSGRKILYFTLNEPQNEAEYGLVDYASEVWLAKGQSRLIPASMLKIKGQHNVANALAALALGDVAGIPMSAMLMSLQSFSGLAHRTQWVLEHNGVNWFNDSKATNVGASIAAIRGLASARIIVILGGQGKGQDFSPLSKVLAKFSKKVLVFGEDAEVIKKSLGQNIDLKIVADLNMAIVEANRVSTHGDVVLLSPACASFDMFRGYEHRGDEFIRLVREVIS